MHQTVLAAQAVPLHSPKNSTVAQAVHVDIPKVSSCTGAARLQPSETLAQLGRKKAQA